MRHFLITLLVASLLSTYAGPAIADYDFNLEVRCLGRPNEECLSTVKAACQAAGGIWTGQIIGRGRLWGCNFPTKDGGKPCKTKNDCQVACIPNKEMTACACYGYRKIPKGFVRECTANGIEAFNLD